MSTAMVQVHGYHTMYTALLQVSKSMGMNWIAVVNLYNEQLKSIQDILARDMMKNIDRSRYSVGLAIIDLYLRNLLI